MSHVLDKLEKETTPLYTKESQAWTAWFTSWRAWQSRAYVSSCTKKYMNDNTGHGLSIKKKPYLGGNIPCLQHLVIVVNLIAQ